MTGKDEIGERSRQRGLQQENQQLNEILQEAKEAIETMRQQMEELWIEKEEVERLQPQQKAGRRDKQKARDIAKAPELGQLGSQDGTNFAHG